MTGELRGQMALVFGKAMRIKAMGIADVFVSYAPHVDWGSVWGFIPTWSADREPDFSFRISDAFGVEKRGEDGAYVPTEMYEVLNTLDALILGGKNAD